MTVVFIFGIMWLALIALFMLTQIIIPLFKGKLLFPLFRDNSEQKLAEELEKLEERQRQAEIDRIKNG